MKELESLFPKHKCGLYLDHNPNRDVYETVKIWISHDEAQDCPFEWESSGHKELAIRTNELWTLTWFPDTPVGSYALAAPSLNALLQWASCYEIASPETKD